MDRGADGFTETGAGPPGDEALRRGEEIRGHDNPFDPKILPVKTMNYKLSIVSPIFLLLVVAAPLGAAVTEEAVWDADEAVVAAAKGECENAAAEAPACFAAAMGRRGAAGAAVAFTRERGDGAFLRGLVRTGNVSVAYVCYPFRANENYGILLLDGDPAVVDVDDPGLLPLADLERDKTYRALKARHPGIALWPGDRWGRGEPVRTETREGGMDLFFTYRLSEGCRACADVGGVLAAFSFDGKRRLQGVRVAGVLAGERIVIRGVPFTEEGLPVEVRPGEVFSVALAANYTTGYRWETEPGDGAGPLLTLGSRYEAPPPGGPVGRGGRQWWSFLALSPGETTLCFSYRRPWEPAVKEAARAAFRVRVTGGRPAPR